MKPTTSAALAIPGKLAKSTTPPPRKAEIIEAMAIRKHAQLCEEYNANRAAQSEIEKQMNALALATLVKSGKWAETPSIHTNYNGGKRDSVASLNVMVETNQIPPELNRLQVRLTTLRAKCRCVPSLHDVKRQIRDAMVGNTAPAERVAAILADPAAAKAIDKMLSELDRAKSAPPALAAV